MAKLLDIYKCELCGNIVSLMHVGDGNLACCGKDMIKMEENTVDASKEKHVPVIEKIDGGYKVKVGSVPHPMEEKHYIEWIEIISDQIRCLAFLKPGETPEATFVTNSTSITAREYCNLHGLWKA